MRYLNELKEVDFFKEFNWNLKLVKQTNKQKKQKENKKKTL